MALADKAQQLDQRITAAVRTALGTLREDLGDRLRQSTESLRERIDGIENALPGQFLAADDLASMAQEEAAQARQDATAKLEEGISELDKCGSQASILTTLLEQARRYGSRAALFLTPDGAARGWQGLGFGEASAPLAEITVSYDTSSGWSELATGRGWVSLSPSECADLASRLECPMAREAVLIPLVLADRVGAALYVDNVDDGAPDLELPALRVLAYSAATSIELLPFRNRQRNPTFEAASSAKGDGLPLWAGTSNAAAPVAVETEPAPETAVAPEAAEAPEPAAPWVVETPAPALPTLDEEAPAAAPPRLETEQPEPSFPASETAKIPLEASDLEPWEETAADFFSPPPGLTQSPEPEISLPPVPESEPLTDISGFEDASTGAMPAIAEDASPLPWPDPPVVAEPDDYELPPFADWVEPSRPSAEEPPRVEPIASTLQMPEINVTEDQTLLIPRSRVAPPSPPPPPPSDQEPEEEATHPGRSSSAATRMMPRATGGSAEVRPPSGIEGPGLAFSRGQRQAAEPAGHEEARRLARLLVSEIRLYNEDQVEEGRRGRDIYSRLRDEIDRSRKMYDERISSDVRTARDYFTEELVRRLADGDPDALGI